MPSNPWDKWFWTDYENAPDLKLCSLAAQGLWVRMLGIMAKADPKGYLKVADQDVDIAGLASIVGRSVDEVAPLVLELEKWKVFSRTGKGRIYNRRMIRDEKKAKIAKKNGRLGGNPSLCNQTENKASDNHDDKQVVAPMVESICQKPESSLRSDGDLFGEKKKPRATRLPENWVPTEADRQYAIDRNVDPQKSFEEFRNYWLSAGKNAAKTNWSLTFRNRVIELADKGRFKISSRSSGL